MSITYNVYANTGAGDPVDYASPLASVAGTSDLMPPLAPGTWTFAVRAQNGTGEEQNVDVVATVIVSANGQDVTHIPAPPAALSAVPLAGGQALVEWCYPPTPVASSPAGFRVYRGPAGSVSYASPVATVAAHWTGTLARYSATITGLSDGASYSFGVRAYNAAGEESNTVTAAATAKASGPNAVQSLSITAIT